MLYKCVGRFRTAQPLFSRATEKDHRSQIDHGTVGLRDVVADVFLRFFGESEPLSAFGWQSVHLLTCGFHI